MAADERDAELAVGPLTPPPHLVGHAVSASNLTDLRASLARHRDDASKTIGAALGAIERLDGELCAFITVLSDRARERAHEVDAAGEALPLRGLPIAVKDCIAVAGVPNTCGSAARRDAVADKSAPTVRALEAGGAVMVGTANLHEWAFGATSQNEVFGAVANPWDRRRIPGGSSGGSAVAVATGMAAAALGTDTGGSIRLPASYCGAAGLKVTTGAVSTDGCFPLSWTMDSIGPMARDVAGLAGPLDALLATGERRFAARVLPPLEKLRVGVWPGARMPARHDAGVHACFDRAVARLEATAASVAEIALPDLDAVAAAQMAIITSEAAAVHPEPVVDRQAYEANVRRLLELGDAVPAVTYVNGLRHRQRAWRDVERVFEDVDVVVSPTTPCTAPLAGAESLEWPDGSNESVLDASIRYLLLWNFVGAPALSFPCGLADGLPVGFQLAEPPGSDRALIELGTELETTLRPAETRTPPTAQ